MYDEKHRLTREGAMSAIKEGGSVLIGGRPISRIEDLPPESEFVKHDPTRAKAALANIQKQREALAQQEADLKAAAEAAPAAAADSTTEGDDASGDGLDSASLPELKRIADEEGVSYNPRTKKADLLQAIRDARTSAADSDGTADDAVDDDDEEEGDDDE